MDISKKVGKERKKRIMRKKTTGIRKGNKKRERKINTR